MVNWNSTRDFFSKTLLSITFLVLLTILFLNFKICYNYFKLADSYISLIYEIKYLVLKLNILFTVIIFLYCTLFFYIVYLIIKKKLSNKKFIVILVIISFTFRLLWILIVDTRPILDFKVLHDLAMKAADGYFIPIHKNSHTNNWPYQVGFILYQSIIIKIFGTNILYLKIFNVIFSTITCVLIYNIGRKIFNESTGRCASILYSTYIGSISLCSVLTNQISSLCIFLLAVNLVVNKPKKLTFITIGILIAIGNILRPEAPLILFSIIVYILFSNDYKLLKYSILMRLKNICGICIIFFLIMQFASTIIVNFNIHKYPLENRNLLWKFVIGLNHDTNGNWSLDDNKRIEAINNYNDKIKEEKRIIKKRTENTSELFIFLAKKFNEFWSDFDNTIFFINSHNSMNGVTVVLILVLEKFHYIFIFVIGTLSALLLFFYDKNSIKHLILSSYMIAFIGIHILVEIQPRYKYSFMIFVFIFGSYSLSIVIKKIFLINQKKLISNFYN